ncbi:hypothetical protein BCR41DRAFT_387512 [Lobosporangium transversale]|uniref:Uncharacterized protein n=1 Tax=Lobosporangium transversale TaxID=64571 RepID=A0A1Y2GJY5_9FUNG|nr:hypothetical protein BCR41DRAFT_387512 [Lobosporangium transversale]ORZ12030.1 hypothetical protein BCR41DRAFT_387512 [Lobosporangium transversale]|eukprot:XP_021879895.1 hypothetical protein BCR41DRAFT_387512 [Lobosporangium transversale]
MGSLHFPTEQRKTIDIGDGLILRWSTKDDTENVGKLLGECFRWLPVGDPHPTDRIPGPNQFVIAAARRLLSGKSAVMSEHDYALVEDTKRSNGKNPIVACVSLHRVRAFYGSVDLSFGKPELIATDPEYRNKGLIRKLLFELVHPESDARGDVLQLIPGIAHFYRQFGYEYGLLVRPNAKIESTSVVPTLAKGKSEPYILRVANKDDLPFLNRLSTPANMHLNATVGTHYSPEYWRYTIHDVFEIKQNRFDGDRDTRIIIDAASKKPVGFTVLSNGFFGAQLEAMALDEQEVSYVQTWHSVLRQLFDITKERQALIIKEREAALASDKEPSDEGIKEAEPESTASPSGPIVSIVAATSGNTSVPTEKDEKKEAPFQLAYSLHKRHPLSLLLGQSLKRKPSYEQGFRVYTRILSYSAFIKKVAPELEKRLANSALAGVNGRLQLDFYRKVEGSSGKGLEVIFKDGKIEDAKDWAKPSPEKLFEERLAWEKEGEAPLIFSAGFMPLTFTPLVTGLRSLTELNEAYGDVLIRDESTRLLLNILFPKGDHHIDVFYW